MRGGSFRRNPPDVGILASLDSLKGPTWCTLIREFYEHTSRFRLSIVAEWRRCMQPGYELFKRLVRTAARPGGDPLQHRRGPAGMVSTIDTIIPDGDEETPRSVMKEGSLSSVAKELRPEQGQRGTQAEGRPPRIWAA